MAGDACDPLVGAQPVWRYSALDLYPRPDAVPEARQHARHVVTEWGYTQIARTAELVVSEIVTNAAHHARETATKNGVPPVRLRLTDWLSGVQIEVWDGSSRMPRAAQQPAPDAEAGRGLLLVEALSDCWGAYPTQGGGKVVFAVIRT